MTKLLVRARSAVRGWVVAGVLTGIFIVLTGLTPGAFFALEWQRHHAILFSDAGRLGVVVAGIILIGVSLLWRRSSGAAEPYKEDLRDPAISPPSHSKYLRSVFDLKTGATADIKNSSIPADLPFTLMKGETGGSLQMDGVKFVYAPAAPSTENQTTSSKPQRDVWLRDAIWYAQSGKWEPQPSDPTTAELVSEQLSDLCAEFRQRAFDGDFPIWGKMKNRDTDGLWKMVPSAHWIDFQLNYLFLIEDGPELLCTEPALPDVRGRAWDHLMTSRDVIRALWPNNAPLPQRAANESLAWLGVLQAVDAFCDPEIVSRRNQYQDTHQSSFERGYEIEAEMRELSRDGWKDRPEALEKYNTLRAQLERCSTLADFAKTGLRDTWGVLRDELCERLISGELTAQGFAEPYQGGSGEVQIKPSEWRILMLNPTDSTAVRRNAIATIVYSGVQIARVKRMKTFRPPSAKSDVSLPVPDMPVRDVFFHIRPDVLENHKEVRWQKVGDDLRDKLSTQQLLAWGREIDPVTKAISALVPIPATYWPHAQFAYLFLAEDHKRDDGNSWTPRNLPTRNDYADIQFSRTQILRMWPNLREG